MNIVYLIGMLLAFGFTAFGIRHTFQLLYKS